MALRIGFKRDKREREPLAEVPGTLKRMQDTDLYMMVEASLMQAQQKLSIYRNSPTLDQAEALTLLSDDITTAYVGTAELLSRRLDDSLK